MPSFKRQSSWRYIDMKKLLAFIIFNYDLYIEASLKGHKPLKGLLIASIEAYLENTRTKGAIRMKVFIRNKDLLHLSSLESKFRPLVGPCKSPQSPSRSEEMEIFAFLEAEYPQLYRDSKALPRFPPLHSTPQLQATLLKSLFQAREAREVVGTFLQKLKALQTQPIKSQEPSLLSIGEKVLSHGQTQVDEVVRNLLQVNACMVKNLKVSINSEAAIKLKTSPLNDFLLHTPQQIVQDYLPRELELEQASSSAFLLPLGPPASQGPSEMIIQDLFSKKVPAGQSVLSKKISLSQIK